MRKLLTATTALALVGGTAFAEITISGDGRFGIDYDSSKEGATESKHEFQHQVGIDFTASGTTDGGLTFGGSAGFDTGDSAHGAGEADGGINTGNTYVSGAFGKLTIGDNDPGSFIAGGIADVGLDGVGVDDIAEALRKGTAATLRYDNSFGDIAVAASGGTADGENEYAAGMSFTAGGMKIGMGFDSNDVISLGLGYTIDQISTNAFYSRAKSDTVSLTVPGIDGDSVEDGDQDLDFTIGGKGTTMGLDVSYSIGASTLTIVYAKRDYGAAETTVASEGNALGADTTYSAAEFSSKSYGIHVAHDLGGGASVQAGFGTVPSVSQVAGEVDTTNNVGTVTRSAEDANRANVGLKFSF